MLFVVAYYQNLLSAVVTTMSEPEPERIVVSEAHSTPLAADEPPTFKVYKPSSGPSIPPRKPCIKLAAYFLFSFSGLARQLF